jgi:hypothetical protein
VVLKFIWKLVCGNFRATPHPNSSTQALRTGQTPSLSPPGRAEFPRSPQSGQEKTLEAYFQSLKEDAVFAVSRFGRTTVVKAALGSEGAALFVLGELGEGAVKPWSLAKVTHEGGKFVHESCGTFFAFEGAEKQFTLIQGLPWEGGDSIDDYC